MRNNVGIRKTIGNKMANRSKIGMMSNAASIDVNLYNNNENDDMCNICYDDINSKPLPNRFGILSHCEHKFCWDCIKKWRSPPGRFSWPLRRSRMRCPVCRQLSASAVPSEVWLDSRQKCDRFPTYVDSSLPKLSSSVAPTRCPPSPPASFYSSYNYPPVFVDAAPTLRYWHQQFSGFMISNSIPGNTQSSCPCPTCFNCTHVAYFAPAPATVGYF